MTDNEPTLLDPRTPVGGVFLAHSKTALWKIKRLDKNHTLHVEVLNLESLERSETEIPLGQFVAMELTQV